MDSKTLSSRLRELVKFLGTVKGDLANVTGPPSMLAPCSVVEVGHCWAQRPAVFAAPALEPCPEKRALLVLRWFLIALRSQLYVGVDLQNPSSTCSTHTATTTTAPTPTNRPTSPPTPPASPTLKPTASPTSKPKTKTKLPSIRKPLNAFLGELFLASWSDPATHTQTRLVAEQVSHHPPITAMHVSTPAHGGVRADGYARVEMTFSGASGVLIRQVGHATLRVDRYGEDYLVPLPDVRVRGFLSGCLYPEIGGTYHIVGSSGVAVEVRFSGEGVFRGRRNAFEARVYRRGGEEKGASIFEVAGCWSEGWTVKDGRTGRVLEAYEVDAPENGPAPMEMPPVEAQDPWESRRAWAGVLRGLHAGDMRTVVAEKTKIEQAQRQMRASEALRGIVWEPLLFRSVAGAEHHVFHRLADGLDWPLQHEKTKGVWRVDDERVKNLQRPFRGELTPFGY